MGRKRKIKNKSEFGSLVIAALTKPNSTYTTQTTLAEATGVSTGYVNQIMVGRKPPSELWTTNVIGALNISDGEKKTFYLAAAKDAATHALRNSGFDIDGYDIDLTEK